MPKEPYEFDAELEEIEKDMSTIFEDIEPVPMRAEFKDELRSKLQNKAPSMNNGSSFNKVQSLFRSSFAKCWRVWREFIRLHIEICSVFLKNHDTFKVIWD